MAFPTNSVGDDLNRADANPISGAYSPAYSSSELKIVSNQATGQGNNRDNTSYRDDATYGPDMECACTIATKDSSTWVELWVRLANPGLTTADGYLFAASFASNVGRYYRLDNGAYTKLGSDVSIAWANGNKIGLEVIGSTLVAYRDSGSGWAAVDSGRTDGTYTAAGYAAWNAGSTTIKIDDLIYGTVVSGPTPVSGDETLAVGLTEGGLVTGIVVGGQDSIPIRFTEAASSVVSVGSSDGIPIGLTEAASNNVSVSHSDDVPIGLTEAASNIASLGSSDSVPIGPTEAASSVVGIGSSDTVPVGVTDSGTVDTGDAVAITGTDTVPLGLIDSGAVTAISVNGQDTINLSLPDAGTLRKALTSADSLSTDILDAALILASLASGETVAMGLTEAGTVDVDAAASITGAETLTVGLAEAGAVTTVYVFSEDSIRLALVEQSREAVSACGADALAVAVDDAATFARGISSTDTLPLVITESGAVLATVVVSDALTLGLDERGCAGMLMAGSDAVAVGMTEASEVRAAVLPGTRQEKAYRRGGRVYPHRTSLRARDYWDTDYGYWGKD